MLVLAQARVGSYLRYGAYPYAIAVRENVGDGIIEHRFVGLFTVAAMNADVLEIPSISRRVREALALAESDPIHPGKLSLDGAHARGRRDDDVGAEPEVRAVRLGRADRDERADGALVPQELVEARRRVPREELLGHPASV